MHITMSKKWFVHSLWLLLAVELLSWLSYGYPAWRTLMTIVVLVVILALACYRLQYGIAAVLAELVVGSQGYLLGITSPNISGRLGLFAVVMLATFIWIIRDRKIYLLQTRYWKWYLALVVMLGLATITALIYGNDPKTIFLDANGYLFIAMILPFTQAIRQREDLYRLFSVLLAGVMILAIQTAIVLFMFSHSGAFQLYLPDLYRWLRDFRLAEISPQDNNFIRVFFQSHIYIVFAFIFASVAYIKQWKLRWVLPLLSGTLTLVLISYSRSFWVAMLGVIGVLTILAGKYFWKYLLWVSVGAVVGVALTLGIINVPLFGSGSGVSASSLLTERTTDLTTEVGGGSRIALLKPLATAAVQRPLLGSGFGTTVTYATLDPRAQQTSNTGLYTTYAFEWGYLDLWLKFGLFGTLLYVAILAAIIVRLAIQAKASTVLSDQVLLLTTAVGLLAVAAIHMLTPYLNHPLGFGWMIWATALAAVFDHKQDPTGIKQL